MMDAILDTIFAERVVVLARGVPVSAMPKVVAALKAGGVKVMEVTFAPADPDTLSKTAEAIRIANDLGLLCGAGTVLEPAMVDAAAEAGARFIISPDTYDVVIRHTKARGLLSIPGAYTPSEVLAAHRLGADIVKVFPVLPDEADYIKVLCGPLPHIPLMATGGVTAQTAASFLRAGARVVAAGACVINAGLVAAGAWDDMARLASELVAAVKDKE